MVIKIAWDKLETKNNENRPVGMDPVILTTIDGQWMKAFNQTMIL